jgi:hypothetical protein
MTDPRKTVLASLLTALLLAGCAGRTANPVPIVQAYDDDLSCQQIAAEIQANEARAVQLAAETKSSRNRNIGVGVVGGILFWPALFALDLSGAAKAEAEALKSRSEHLANMRVGRGCGTGQAAPEQARAAPMPVAAPPASTAGVVTAPAPASVSTGPAPVAPTPPEEFWRDEPSTASRAAPQTDSGPCGPYSGDEAMRLRCEQITGPDKSSYVPVEGWNADLDDQMRCHPHRERITDYESCLRGA